MKKLIKQILNEEVVNQKIKKFYDYIVNDILNKLVIEKDDHAYRSFDSIGDMLNQNILTSEYENLVSDPELFGKYGWNHYYDVDEQEDYFYYGDNDDPENYITNDEFQLEVGYDWLDDMVKNGDIGFDEDRGEWFLNRPDILVKMTNVNDKNGTINFSFPLWWNPFYSRYDIPVINNPNNRIFLMRLIESYGIEASLNMYDVLDLIIEKIPEKVNYLLKENNLITETIIDNFIDFGKNYLSLPNDFKVILTDNGSGIDTLGNYNIKDKTIKILTKDRAIPDIIRSIAHEMVHHQQNDRGDLKGSPEEGETGSPWEDEANAKAGKLVRDFGEENPEIYDL